MVFQIQQVKTRLKIFFIVSYKFHFKIRTILFFIACHAVTVHLFDNNGTSSSECFVELDSETDINDALKKSGSYLDKKIIEGEIGMKVKLTANHSILFSFSSNELRIQFSC